MRIVKIQVIFVLAAVGLVSVVLFARSDRRAVQGRSDLARAKAGTSEVQGVGEFEVVRTLVDRGLRAEDTQVPTGILPDPEDVASKRAPEDLSVLRDWILALPDADFSKLVGTSGLDRLVSKVIRHLHGRPGEAVDSMDAVGAFLAQLNGRIRMATRVSDGR